MKKVALGIIIGIFLVTAIPAAAEEINKRVTATVRNDFTVEVDGKKAKLENAPLAYDGSSYLPVREVANLLGKEVDFKDGVIKLNTPAAALVEIQHKGLRAVKVDSETYFSAKDYNDKYEPILWGFDLEMGIIFLADNRPTESKLVHLEIDQDEPGAVTIYKGETYINVKYYKEPADLKPAE
ncbi:stalk domain-containing protein [Paenibacillus sp. GXUN7292]|uniref:stalk domain-containing protein n=1 Tax=Paenibacillus sp. GXUN7292 TaxID=3422499 RepID=UPI003D7CA00F